MIDIQVSFTGRNHSSLTSLLISIFGCCSLSSRISSSFFLMTEMIDMSGKVKEISVTTGLTLILALFLLRA